MIVGIDPSLASTGICVLDKTRKLENYKILSFPASDPYRLYWYHQFLFDFLNHLRTEVRLIGIESPVAFGKYSSTMGVSIGKIHGVFESVFQIFHIDYVDPLPKQIKKFITGNGNAEKDEVKNFLEATWGYEIEWKNKNQIYDLYDALGIAVFTYYFYYRKKQKQLTKSQKEIIQGVKKRYDKKRAKFRY